jgi:short-subunit dehydrogenase
MSADFRRKAGRGNDSLIVAGIACAATVLAAMTAYRRKKSKSLQGQIVVVTGSSRGLGLALAEECGRRGAKIVLTARDAEELERARLLLLKRHAVRSEADIFVHACDLRSPEQAEDLMRRVTDHFGRIDILVNNAGVITVGPVENQTVQEFHDVMDANFFTGVHCTLSVLPQMLARGRGAIVNITSIGGKVAVPHLLPYTASKFAAVGFSEGLNAELHSKGICVTTVCPGLMRTGSHLNALFTGDASREYRWFSLAASSPGLSIGVAAAARQVVCAMIDRKSEIAITPQAILAARFGNILPAATTRLMTIANRFLPRPNPSLTPLQRGSELRDRELTPATALGSYAARRYNQFTPAEKP